MSISLKALNLREPHNFSTTNLTQNGPGQSLLLLLPIELIRLIGKFCSTGHTSKEAAWNAVNFGKVCALTHLITHDIDEIDAIISFPAAIEEVIDASKNRRMTGGDIGTPISEEDQILWNEHVNLCKILYSIFKRTIEPVNDQNISKFTVHALETFQDIQMRCCLGKPGVDYTRLQAEQILRKSTLILQTFCNEIVKDILLVHAKNSLTKEHFEEEVQEIKETFKNVKNFFGYPLMDMFYIKVVIASGLDETLNHISSLIKTKTLKIEHEAKTLENELQILRGPNHFDGTINELYRQKLSAQANGETENATFFGKLFNDQVNRLNQIALFDGSGRIIGGTLAELYAKLHDPKEMIKEDSEIQEAREMQTVYETMLSFLL